MFNITARRLTGLGTKGRAAAGAVGVMGGASSRSAITLGRAAAMARLRAARLRPNLLGTAILKPRWAARPGSSQQIFPWPAAEVAGGGHGRAVAVFLRPPNRLPAQRNCKYLSNS